MLHIYNSLTRNKEPFTPIDADNVRMYVCGMTVYDLCHVGHARVLVVFDVVYRYLRRRYGEQHVTYVRNVTDIDDKIIKRANERGEEARLLASRFVDEMHKDAEALGVLPPDQEPRATHHIRSILAMIQSLKEKGFAYQAENGDVYFDVSSFDRYGRLSGRNLEDERAGARVEVDMAKDDPLDFVLWKMAKHGEPSWNSPWGAGRPGWHIECSAMSTECLGHHFDIHGGGMDLKFPHHENEIAQSEAATGETFVNVWMHNGHVMVDEEKMSKSLGNFFTVREVLKQYQAEVVRYFILTSHYRSPLNYSQENLDNAKAALDRFYTALRGMEMGEAGDTGEYGERFFAAMDDDFNTPGALAVLFDLVRDINRAKTTGEAEKAEELGGILRRLGGLLGILQKDADEYFKGEITQAPAIDDDAVEALIEQRNEARKNRDWVASDRIRDELKSHGIVLEDGAAGTLWRRG